jgi:hypothetical protein
MYTGVTETTLIHPFILTGNKRKCMVKVKDTEKKGALSLARFSTRATERKTFNRVILYGMCNASKIKRLKPLNIEDSWTFPLGYDVVYSCHRYRRFEGAGCLHVQHKNLLIRHVLLCLLNSRSPSFCKSQCFSAS